MSFYVRMILCAAVSVAPIASGAQQTQAVLETPHRVADLAGDPAADRAAASAPALLPDAPEPQQAPQQPAPNPDQGTSSSQAQQQPSDADKDKSQHEKAEQQIKEQERQRVLGIVPAFNTTYRGDAVALTAGQKIKLAFRSSTDPVAFAEAFFIAGYHELNDDYSGFGWGAEGYFKRVGAAYLDGFDGAMIGNGILPAILHQDPRYFRLGRGSFMHRTLYAASTSFICKTDKSRRWVPNISNVGGNIAAGAISNLYYPSKDTGWGQTIGDGMLNTVVGMFGGIFQEWWPDVSRKFLHKDMTHGLQPQDTK